MIFSDDSSDTENSEDKILLHILAEEDDTGDTNAAIDAAIIQ